MSMLPSPQLSATLQRLTAAMPDPWIFERDGREVRWVGQPIGAPVGVRPVIELDRRGALQLDPSRPSRRGWRKPATRQQLIACIHQWAAQRTAQWASCVDSLGLSPSERLELISALQRLEWRRSSSVTDRIWRASLNARLMVPTHDDQGSDALLRWVLAPRQDAEYRRRRALARRQGRLLALAGSAMALGGQLWPWCVRRLGEPRLIADTGFLRLPNSVRQRIGRYPLHQAPRWVGPKEELAFWARLGQKLHGSDWPTEADELEAAHQVLRFFSPLANFGLIKENLFRAPLRLERGGWLIGQLHKNHGGSWRSFWAHCQSDVETQALMSATLPRIQELFAADSPDDPWAVERATQQFRDWTPGRWLAALREWHARCMPGAWPPPIRWQPALKAPVAAGSHWLGSAATSLDLRQFAQEMASPHILAWLVPVMRGDGIVLWLRQQQGARRLVLLALVQAAPEELSGLAASEAVGRRVSLYWAEGLDETSKEVAAADFDAAMASGLALDTSTLHWDRDWQDAKQHPEFFRSVAASLRRAWQSIAARQA